MSEAMKRLDYPGFALETFETKTGGHVYEVEVLQATGEGLEPEERILSGPMLAWYLAYEAEGKDPNEVIAAILNASQAQGGKQGQKSQVLAAVQGKPYGKDGEVQSVEEAEEGHRKVARIFLQGAPRGGGGARHESGLTAKMRQQLGDAVSLEMAKTGAPPTKARMDEICHDLGIDPSQL